MFTENSGAGKSSGSSSVIRLKAVVYFLSKIDINLSLARVEKRIARYLAISISNRGNLLRKENPPLERREDNE